MPYYLTKVTNHLKNISKVSRPTFMIEQLSSFVLDKHSLLVAQWLQNISNAMHNPQKIAHIILIQPEKKDEINVSEGSLILHLCPAQAVNDFINYLANPDINWVVEHDNWLETFEEEDDQEQNDDIQECAQRLREYLGREDFDDIIEHTGLDNTNEVHRLFNDLQTLFTQDLSLYWVDIINVFTDINYGDMSPECLELLDNGELLGPAVLSSDDDLSDDDEYDSMPELVDSEEDIIYDRTVLPWWSQPSHTIQL